MHVLVFPGWYPSRVDELSGDFIQRHMVALSAHCEVSVVFATKDTNATSTTRIISQQHNLQEERIYYPSASRVPWIDNIISFVRYQMICIKAARQLHRTNTVSIVQLYVLQKNFLLGIVLKMLLKVPFVVSEQSTIYVDGSFEKSAFLRKHFFKKAFQAAASWHVVSRFLQENISRKLYIKKPGVVIGNVVDTELFTWQPHTNNVFTFVHVSNMFAQKNVEGMLEAFALVKKLTDRFQLHLVGPLPPHLPALIEQLALQKHITIWNQRTYPEVAAVLQSSDAFVFFTRYETFGCVTIEANACGLPVIITDLPVSQELVEEGQNGLFVRNENIEELSQKLLMMIHGEKVFDGQRISQNTHRQFSYNVVGLKLFNWLNDQILHR